MKKHIKPIGIVVSLFLALMVFLMVAGTFYLKTEHARRLVQDTINQKITGSISLGKMEFFLLRGGFEFKNVLLKSPSGNDLAGCDRFFVNLSWFALFNGNILISESILERPWTQMRIDRQGNIDMVQAFLAPAAPKEPPEKNIHEKKKSYIPFSIVVKSFKVVRGSVDCEITAQNLKIALQDIGLSADANLLEKSGNLILQIAKATLKSPDFETQIDPLHLAATLKADRIDPLTCRLDTKAMGLNVSGKISNVFSQPLLDLAVDVDVSLAEARKILKLEPVLSGHITGHMNLSGRPENPDVKLHIDYGGGLFAETRIDRADADLYLRDRRLHIDHLRANIASGELNLNGDIDLQRAFAKGFLAPPRNLDDVAFRLGLTQTGLRLEELFGNFKTLTGTVNAVLNLEGRGISLPTLTARADLNIQAEKLSVGSAVQPASLRLQAQAHLEKGLAELKAFSTIAGDIHLEGQGRYDIFSDKIAASLNLEAPDLAPGLSSLGIRNARGKLKLNAKIAGPLKQPAGSILLNGSRIAFQDIFLGNVALKADLDTSGRLNVSEFSLENQGSEIRGAGTVQLFAGAGTDQRRRPANFTAAFHRLEVRNFLSPEFAAGILDGKLRIGGSLDALEASLALQGKHLSIKNIRLGNLAADLRLAGEKIRIDTLKIELAPGETVTGSGWISRQKSFEFELASPGIALEHIDKIRQQNIAQGKIVFDFSGAGDLANPRINGNIALQNLRISGKAIKDTTLRLDLHDQLARITGRLNFDLDGRYHLQKKDFSASLLFDQTELAPYFKLADREDLSGTLTGKVQVSGNTNSIGQIRGITDVSNLEVFLKGQKLLQAKSFKVLMANEEIFIPGLDLALAAKGRLEIKGKGKFKGPLALEATGNIPLEVLNIFVEDIFDNTGNILLSARLEGTLDEPQIQADVYLEKIGFTLPAVFHKLQGINGRIAMTPRTITLDGIQGKLDTGRFDLSGQIEIQSLQPLHWNLALKATELPVAIPDTLDMLLNADLKLLGSPSKSTLFGEAILLEGVYYRNINLSLLQAIDQKQREPLPAGPKNIPLFLKNMDFNVNLSARKPLQVDNNLARLDIMPDLHLTGTPDTPVISGRAVVESGTIQYRKNTFIVKKGIVDFVNPYKIEPLIDIESETRVQDWNITLKLAGTPDNLGFQLRSDPPEADADIISLLLFRKTTRKLIQGEGGMTQSAERLLAEMIDMTWGEDIKKASGLDILEIETHRSGGKIDPNRTKVTLGKELSRRMTIKYALESKNGEMVQRAVSEYKLLENILVNGFQDNKGIFGGEVKLRLEFR